jgi:hypothetical protein
MEGRKMLRGRWDFGGRGRMAEGFLARFGIWRSFAKKLNLCVQTEKKE